MKLLSASAVLFTSAMADKWGQLGDIWNGAANNENLSDDDRKIIELFTISSVANYGCWCRFNNYKPYKGQAQDTVDEACMQWYKNYDCLHLDYSTNTPWFRCNIDTPYNDTLTKLQEPFELTTDYMTECANENPGNDCAAVACAVDAEFIRHVFLYLADNTLNMTPSGWYGFDGSVCNPGARDGSGTTQAPGTTAPQPANPTTAPGGTTAAPEPTLDCCGAYPNRFPFKLQSGNRQCCVDKTYNVQLLECCAPGMTLEPVGTC